MRSPTYDAVKRFFDVVLATFLVIACAPLLIVVAILIKVTSPGPVLFRQTRVGRGGRQFICYKYRSMVNRAEEFQAHLHHRNEVAGPVFKLRDDPRVTRLGKILRRTSIDELPQLFNVIKGDMSVVGPRPPVPSEVRQYSAYQLQRLSVIPGLTCLWQISGRSLIGFEQWVELDLEYIRSRSLGLDLKILIRTIPAVLRGKGAH